MRQPPLLARYRFISFLILAQNLLQKGFWGTVVPDETDIGVAINGQDSMINIAIIMSSSKQRNGKNNEANSTMKDSCPKTACRSEL